MTTVAAGLAAYNTEADVRAARLRLGLGLPTSGWLADYVNAVTPLTDAPVDFHLASGLCALSGAIGNRLSAVHWGQNVFPNLWAVLVAPSSFWRKSTSINQAEGLLQAAAPDRTYPTEFSREKLLRVLAKDPAGLLTAKEFGGFLAGLGRDYNAGLKENLTELYDGPELFKRSLQSGDIEIRRPAVTILGATTLDWLEGRITEGDLQGGFLARFLFVTAREKASAKGLTGGMDPGLRTRLLTALHDISEIEARLVEYEPEAKDLLEEWAEGWEHEAMSVSHRADLSGFAVRLQTYAIKLAMLYRLSSTYGDDPGARIDEPSVAAAIAYCRVLWANVTGLIDEKIAITKEAKELRRVASIIGSGSTKSNALKLSKLKARDFDQYLDTLVQSGQVSMAQVHGSEVGLERAQDKKVTWLAPVVASKNGHSDPGQFTAQFPSVLPGEFPSVHGEPTGTERNGELTGNSRELSGPSPRSDSTSVLNSLSSTTPTESGAHEVGVYARDEVNPPDGQDSNDVEDRL